MEQHIFTIKETFAASGLPVEVREYTSPEASYIKYTFVVPQDENAGRYQPIIVSLVGPHQLREKKNWTLDCYFMSCGFGMMTVKDFGESEPDYETVKKSLIEVLPEPMQHECTQDSVYLIPCFLTSIFFP